jgi:molecular chaperone GrpE
LVTIFNKWYYSAYFKKGESMSDEQDIKKFKDDIKDLKEDIEDLKSQIQEKDTEIQEKDKSLEEYQERILRMQADFDNYKKRNEKELQEYVNYANEGLIIKIIEAYEDLQRALNSRKSDDLQEGVELIYQKLTKILEEEGLEEIPCEGENFDPFRHEALMAEDHDEYENGKVIEELGRGYTLNSKVIKYSKVKVCKKK